MQIKTFVNATGSQNDFFLFIYLFLQWCLDDIFLYDIIYAFKN